MLYLTYKIWRKKWVYYRLHFRSSSKILRVSLFPYPPSTGKNPLLIYRSHEGLSGPDAIDLYIGDNGMHFRFHKTVLNAYTSYFNEFFRNMPMAAINEIYLPELDPDRVVELFNKLYLGRREDWDWMDLLPAKRKWGVAFRESGWRSSMFQNTWDIELCVLIWKRNLI